MATYEALSLNQNSWLETSTGRRYEVEAYCGHQHKTPQQAWNCARKQWAGTTYGINNGIERNDGERMVEVLEGIWVTEAQAAEYRAKEQEEFY